MKSQDAQTLVVQFKNEIAFWEIPLFRGCVIRAMEDANVLYHNHLNDDEFRYRYPLIQYKRINRCAALVCVGEGTEVISEFFNHANFEFQLGTRLERMEIDRVNAKRTPVQVCGEEYRYVIRKWLPLSSDNYRTYLTMEGVVEQCAFLQNILVGNILSFCKGLDITIEREIRCVILNVMAIKAYNHKGVKMMGFDVEFKCNVSLPENVGLGKGVGFGFGTIVKSNK